ncbi:MAG: chitobiase/beta-hexosaminidase C-terminal domain-containing protein [Fibrobacterota bacterium]
MKKLLMLVLTFVAFAQAIEVKDLNIAVIWNGRTDSRLAPRGWKVGFDTTGSGMDTTIEACPAPEIGKAQLKNLLASFDNTVSFDSTLDTTGIPDEMRTGGGIPSGPYQGKFKRVRIYSRSSFPLDLAAIKNDYNNVKPDAIIYINAGAEWATPGGDDQGLYKLLRDAADDDIGIMTIGDASLTDAKSIDPSKTRFPVMGVQKTYRFKAFGSDPMGYNDTIREFNFLAGNDTKDWEVPDTVVLHSNYQDGKTLVTYWIETLKGDTIYISNNNGTSKTNNTILSDSDILHAYGEWSINAKAVEVMDNDLYAPEMASGVFPNHDLILKGTGYQDNVTVSVSDKEWGEVMWVNGDIHARLNDPVPNHTAFGSSQGQDFVFDKDYVVEKANIDNPAKTDKIRVIEKGATIGLQSDYYYDTYYAGGYKDLKIRLFDDGSTKKIFSEVLPTLKSKGITELAFKPWTKGGRIKADADIWAVNEKLPLEDFDDISSNGFDPNAYYRAYLGDQVAGAKNTPHFVKPPEVRQDFDKPAKDMRLDSLGYDQDGKLYHVISAIQNGHRRMVMLGFQPSYLKNSDAVLDLLEDATKWIAINDYQLPDPEIIPVENGTELTPADGQKIYTDQDTVLFRMDFTKKGIVLHEAGFDLNYEIDYDGNTQTGTITIPADDGSDHIEEAMIDLSTELSIDPAQTAATEVTIRVTAEPLIDPAPYDKSNTTEAELKLRKLTAEFKNGGNDQTINYSGTYDEEIISDTTIFGNSVSDVAVRYSENGGPWHTEPADYAFAVNSVALSLQATARKDRYVNADTLRRTYKKDDLKLPRPELDIDPASVNGTGDYLFFRDTALFMGLESYSVGGIDVVNDDYTLAFNLNGDNRTMADTGRVELSLTYIDSLIDAGETALSVDKAVTKAVDTDTWKNSDFMDQKKYHFRAVDLSISKNSGDSDDSRIDVVFTAKDPVTGAELNSADIYYTTDGSAPDNSSSGPVVSSDPIDIPNGVRVRAVAYRSGYISGQEDATYSKELWIDADPGSGTFFGESLDVRLTSNGSPILYTIDGSLKDTITDTTGVITLDDNLASLIRDNDTVRIEATVEGGDNISGVTEEFLYYRRKLPAPDVSPKSGKYAGTVDVTMSVAVDKSHDAVIYHADNSGVSDADTRYTGMFTVLPDTVLFARAYAKDWLPSDVTEREYTRVAQVNEGLYFDSDGDGVIDSAEIELDTVFDELVLPDYARAVFPDGDTVRVDQQDISFSSQGIALKIDNFTGVKTGFSRKPRVRLYGERYSNEYIPIGDAVAPVISKAVYSSGEYDRDGNRSADTLIVRFTEPVNGISSSAISREILFNYIGNAAYTAEVSLISDLSSSEYRFSVDSLMGVTYPSATDSIWINVAGGIPAISDDKGNTQVIESNRRVQMEVGRLAIRVVMTAHWIDRLSDGFDKVDSPDDVAQPVGDYSTFGMEEKGGMVLIDPQIPYLESEVSQFRVKLVILDAVGNIVAQVDRIGEGEHIKALPAEYIIDDQGNTRYIIAVAWDGTNRAGRPVSSGPYKVIALTQWPNIEGAIESTCLISVKDTETDK